LEVYCREGPGRWPKLLKKGGGEERKKGETICATVAWVIDAAGTSRYSLGLGLKLTPSRRGSSGRGERDLEREGRYLVLLSCLTGGKEEKKILPLS